MNHEAFHGIGLEHTHKNGTTIKKPQQKIVYPNANKIPDPTGATDNYMSYASSRKEVWQWQLGVVLDTSKR